MKKLKMRNIPAWGGIFFWMLAMISSPSVTQAKTLSEAFETFKVLEFKEKMSAPAFELKNLNGNIVKLQDYKGKPMLLYFWTTWCGVCKKDLPGMNKVYNEFKDQGLVFLFIDYKEEVTTVEKAVKERGYTFPVLLDDTGEITRNYGVRGTPTVYLIDREGNVIGGAVGERNWDSEQAREILKLMLQ